MTLADWNAMQIMLLTMRCACAPWSIREVA